MGPRTGRSASPRRRGRARRRRTASRKAIVACVCPALRISSIRFCSSGSGMRTPPGTSSPRRRASSPKKARMRCSMRWMPTDRAQLELELELLQQRVHRARWPRPGRRRAPSPCGARRRPGAPAERAGRARARRPRRSCGSRSPASRRSTRRSTASRRERSSAPESTNRTTPRRASVTGGCHGTRREPDRQQRFAGRRARLDAEGREQLVERHALDVAPWTPATATPPPCTATLLPSSQASAD